MNGNDIRAIALDLDDTLAESKSPMDPRMAAVLARLLAEVQVCIISGGRCEQFEQQVRRRLDIDPALLRSLHLMPTCGTRYYRWEQDSWQPVYAEDISPEDKEAIAALLEKGAKELGLWSSQTYGDIIEDRGSQITVSALGQKAPPPEKYAWDPDNSKKKLLRDYVAARLPEFEARVGGSTSVDVTRKGIDKAYGMRKLMSYLNLLPSQILFLGDRLYEGGNDYPVISTGIRCVPVSDWQDTLANLRRFLDEPSV